MGIFAQKTFKESHPEIGNSINRTQNHLKSFYPQAVNQNPSDSARESQAIHAASRAKIVPDSENNWILGEINFDSPLIHRFIEVNRL